MSESELHFVVKDDGDDPNRVFVMGEVYAPNIPDTDGEFMTAEEIRKMAHDYTAAGELDDFDLMHDGKPVKNVRVVESFISHKSDTRFIPDSWVIGVVIEDPVIVKKVRKGELNGFSMEALVHKEDPVEIEVDMPPILRGLCSREEGHDHDFYVSYDEQGRFQGGRTSPGPDGHYHVIKRSTATERANGHNHRFSHVEDLVMVEPST